METSQSKTHPVKIWIDRTYVDAIVMIIIQITLGIMYHFFKDRFGVNSGFDFVIFYYEMFSYQTGFFYLPHFQLFFAPFAAMEYNLSMNVFWVLVLCSAIGLVLAIKKFFQSLAERWALYALMFFTTHYEFSHLNLDFTLALIFLLCYRGLNTKHEWVGAIVLAFVMWKVNFILALIPIFIQCNRRYRYLVIFTIALLAFNAYYLIWRPELWEALIAKFMRGGAIFIIDSPYPLFRNMLLRDYHLIFILPIVMKTISSLALKWKWVQHIEKVQWLLPIFGILWFWIIAYMVLELKLFWNPPTA